MKYWGEHVFEGVITPALTFVLDKQKPSEEIRVVNAEGVVLIVTHACAPFAAASA